MSLAARRAAALNALARRQPSAGQRFPGETQPSGDMPDDPWEAEVYLAERDCLDDAAPSTPPPQAHLPFPALTASRRRPNAPK